MIAVKEEQALAIRELLDAGAQVLVENQNGDTPLMLQRELSEYIIEQIRDQKKQQIQKFLDRTFKPPTSDKMKHRIKTLIRNLSVPQLAQRKKAQEKLSSMGIKPMYYLKQHWNHSNPERRNRVRRIIEQIAIQSYNNSSSIPRNE